MRRSAAWGGGVVVVAIAVAVAVPWWLWRGPVDPEAAHRASRAQVGAQVERERGGSAADEARASLAGRVTSAGGGVAGAVVALTRVPQVWALVPAIAATTDASGAWAAADVAAGDYVIAATARGYQPAVRGRLTVAPGAALTGLDLALAAGGVTVRGHVTDIGGGPVGGVRIGARELDVDEGAELVAVSDADGAYALTLAEDSYTLVASHDDYAREQRSVDAVGHPAPVDFVLLPGGTIRGVVIARDSGKPVAGAIVDASHLSEQQTVTAADGTFTLHQVEPGAIDVHVWAHGYATREPVTVGVAIGEHVDGVRIVVDPALSIRGRVVRAGNVAQGIADVRVFAYGHSVNVGSSLPPLAPSDAEGRFELVGARALTYEVESLADNYISPKVKVIVADRDVDGVVVSLAAGATLTGRVDPAAPAKVAVQRAEATADAHGVFVLHTVPAGATSIVATTVDGQVGILPIVVADADQTGLVVHLDPHASVSGKVVDTHGDPVAGALVAVTSAGARIERYGYDGLHARSEVDGTFRVMGLDAGKVDIKVYSDGSPRPSAATSRLDLVAGIERTGVTLTVEARDGVIRGLVTTADAKPLPDAWVTARLDPDPDHGAWSTTVLTGSDGRFTVTGLRRATYVLDATGPRDITFAHRGGVHTGEDVTLVVDARPTLAVRVALGGTPILAYDLACDGPTRLYGRRIEAPTGAYVIDRLEPGHYVCTAVADAGMAEGAIDLVDGAASLDLAATPWASLTAVVVDVFTGQPVPGLMAETSSELTHVSQSHFDADVPITDASGRFVSPRIAPGHGYFELVTRGARDYVGFDQYTAVAGQRLDLGTIKAVRPPVGGLGRTGIVVAAHTMTVAKLEPDSPAAQAGIRVGDVIVAIDGHAVADLAPVASLVLESIGVGQHMQLTLARGVTVTVTAIALD